MLVLKHLYDWSFDECEREVRGSLVYRAFCRIDGERVSDAETLIRLAHLLDEPVLKDLLAQLVMRGRERRVIRGRRLRVDTTVVETNIHYPTDATLLGDGIRVVTRTLRRLGERVRQRTRSVGRRLFEIGQRSRTAGPRAKPKVRAQSKARMKTLYQELVAIARAVLRQADGVVAERPARPPAIPQLSVTMDLLRRVVAQTRARVLRGNTHFPGKVVSVFEPHTEIIPLIRRRLADLAEMRPPVPTVDARREHQAVQLHHPADAFAVVACPKGAVHHRPHAPIAIRHPAGRHRDDRDLASGLQCPPAPQRPWRRPPRSSSSSPLTGHRPRSSHPEWSKIGEQVAELTGCGMRARCSPGVPECPPLHPLRCELACPHCN